MKELISGKEALIALANGEEVEVSESGHWLSCDHVKALQVERIIEDYYQFRLKPRTITLNGIEVPVPFVPKDGEFYWSIWRGEYGYYRSEFCGDAEDEYRMYVGAWRTEEEIKQVVAALRSIFNKG